MALTLVAGVLLSNADRLYVSRFLPASDLGRYTLAFTATGLLQMGIQPFYRAFFPRFSELVARDDPARLRQEYYQGCRLVASILIPTAAIGFAFAPEIFRLWVGTSDATTAAVFRWLLIGITGAGLMWLPAAYQQAQGWTRLHAGMIIGALVVGFPILVLTTRAWGAVGATAIWVLHGVSDITLGLWLMHRRLLRGELGLWYRAVLLPPVAAALCVVGPAWWLMPRGYGAWVTLVWLAGAGAVALLGSLLLSAPRAARHHEAVTGGP
jgi:O-antigen/teichoic acid export membrane protein